MNEHMVLLNRIQYTEAPYNTRAKFPLRDPTISFYQAMNYLKHRH